jgi:hypothetical protein
MTRPSPGRHYHSTLPLAVVDCHCVGIYTLILLPLLSFSVKMTVPPRAGPGRAGPACRGERGPEPLREQGRRAVLRVRPQGGSGPARGGYAPLAFPTVNRVCMALLYARVGRLTVENGGFRPGQSARRTRSGWARTARRPARSAPRPPPPARPAPPPPPEGEVRRISPRAAHRATPHHIGMPLLTRAKHKL